VANLKLLDRQSAALALRLHFLFEACRLDLLPDPLARSTWALASAIESRAANQVEHAAALRDAFLEASASLGLADLEWPSPRDRQARRALALALSECQGESVPAAAAERLGRSCEKLANAGGRARGSGSYYTPPWVADRIARVTLATVLQGRKARPLAPLSLRVLDPAIGAGVFALAAVAAIANAVGEQLADARAIAARDCIYGIEVNELAAETCRLAVWLGASRPGRPAAIPGEHISVRDALASPPRRRDFDLVIGNPPWGVRVSAHQAQAWTQVSPQALRGHHDSFLFFLGLAAEAARDDGAIGLLLPDAVLTQVRYERMRHYLLQRFRPLEVVLLGAAVFAGATAPACLLCLAGWGVAPRRYRSADLRRVARGELQRAVAGSGPSVPSSLPSHAPHHSFLVAPGWLRSLSRRLTKRFPGLGGLPGVEFHDVGINYARAEIGRAVLYEGPREDPRDTPIARGRDFRPFSGIGHSAWLRHDWESRLGPAGRLWVRSDTYRLAPKLLFRQTGDRPIATLDPVGVWFGRSVIAVAAPDPRTVLFLVALFNTRAFAALYRALTPEAGRSFAQVKVSKLKLLPVPTRGRQELADLADALLRESDDKRKVALVGRLDRAAYRAYGLTAEEVARIEQSVMPCLSAASPRRSRPAATWSARRRR
jgi:hypothetical protein